MNALRLTLAQLARRPLQTILVIVLLGLGVATLLALTVARAQFSEQLTRDARGIDLVVGAKGSPLQLILSALYHVDVPPGNVPLGALPGLRAQRLVKQAIPISLGDNYRGFRIVGTEAALIEHYGGMLREGVVWQGKLQAVIGAQAARETRLGLGGRFFGTHGLASDGFAHEDAEYRVVGVLAPTGTVLDRLILTDLASVWFTHEGETKDPEELKVLQGEREVTAILVQYASPLAAAVLPRQINADPKLAAAVPAAELARLFAVAGVGVEVIRVFALVLVGSSLLVLFVALMNALEERRYDFAVLRLLGSSRAKVAGLLLLETWTLAAGALVVGAVLAWGALAATATWLAQARSFSLSPWSLAGDAWWVPLLAVGVATAAAALPMWRVSRMSLHQTLAEGKE
jgi:putative ABC transport system permease protein